jgi:hypothetical protein
MPKRKRSAYEDDGDRVQSMRKKDVSEKLTQSRKLLHRALKTAKGFERQKLGKRLKNATEAGSHDEVERIKKEIEALKGLDLDKMTEAQLHKSLLKIKAFAESELLPEEVRTGLPKPEGTEEEKKALHNVTSGMWNMKPVKEVMDKVMSGMYIALGIPAPAKKQKGKAQKELKGIMKTGAVGVPRRAEEKESEASPNDSDVESKPLSLVSESAPSSATSHPPKPDLAHGNLFGASGLKAPKSQKGGNDADLGEKAESGSAEPSWEGFDSEDESEDSDAEGGPQITDSEEDGSLDEETLSRYDALLGGSSDEESFDESKYDLKRSSKPSARLSLSLSPEPSEPSSPSEVGSQPPSPPPQKAPKALKTKTAKPPPAKAGGSTFLPTLMGGYWSGSESSASDLEDSVAAPVRKNRPGQMARRAIWEKKFGERANHIKKGQGTVADKRGKGKDDGWDAKRGAKDGGDRSGRGRGGGRGRGRDFRQVTGENALPVEPRKMVKKRDDTGPLHPSWQAAKAAKEAKQTATFQGKKVTFD